MGEAPSPIVIPPSAPDPIVVPTAAIPAPAPIALPAASPAPRAPDYATTLLQDAQAKYAFIKQHNPVVSVAPRPDPSGPYANDYAETWLPGDSGDAKTPRPANVPLGGVGVQVYRPNAFGPDDLAAEMLHVDPVANQARGQLMQSLSASQMRALKEASDDYAVTLAGGESRQKAMQNALDSALRGYTVGQWPAETNASMRYTPYQLQILNNLKSYMVTGKR